MQTKPRAEMEADIMEAMSDKVLSFWCKVKKGEQDYYLWQKDDNIYTIVQTNWYKLQVVENNFNNNQYIKWEFCKVIWHTLFPHHILKRLKVN